MIGLAMVGRSARYLAPVVLVATAVGASLIVTHHTGGGSRPATTSHLLDRGSRPHGKYARATFYTVKAGDSLTSISVKTGIPVTTLEQLNPSLDPNTLQTGQRLRLRR